MADEANPKGMKRPMIPVKPTGDYSKQYAPPTGDPVDRTPPKRMAKRGGYGPHSKDDPKSSRPIIPIHTKNKNMGMKQFAVGEGNNYGGMTRPDMPRMVEKPARKPYDQSKEPADYSPFPDDLAPFKKGERFEGPPGAGNYTAF